ncbi:c-type cytochrome [Amorphus sp. 3PC139-8]
MEDDVPEPAADVEKGQQVAEELCSGCHAVGTEGASSLPEAPPFRFLGRNYPVRYLQEALAEGIVTGHPDMPEFAWDPVTINNFIAYLETIQVPE